MLRNGSGGHRRYDFPQRPPLKDEQRFAVLRRLLHDHDIGLRERLAGSVLLLYAQPLTRIAQLRTPTSRPLTAARSRSRSRAARSSCQSAGHDRARPRYQRVADGEEEWGITSRPGGHGALLALAGRLPSPILAERLGIHQSRAAQWARAAGATYSRYVELRIARDSAAFRKRIGYWDAAIASSPVVRPTTPK